MLSEKRYEELKTSVIQTHRIYIEIIEKSVYTDLQNLQKRLHIFDLHIETLKADIELRDAILQYIREVEF